MKIKLLGRILFQFLPQSNERPAQIPSSQIIFQVVLSPAAPLMQLNVISVPVSKPSSISANRSPFLFQKTQVNHQFCQFQAKMLTVLTCKVWYLRFFLVLRMLYHCHSCADSNCHCFQHQCWLTMD